MIVSCAPFRVSFAGGGSDIASFYRRRRGAVLSCAIAKYSFIVVHPFFSATKYHLKYARTELVDRLDEIQHPILREALRMQSVEPGVEVVSVAGPCSNASLGRAAGAVGVLVLVMAPTAIRYSAAHHGAQSEAAKIAANGSFGVKQTLDNLIRDSMLNFNTGIPQVDDLTNGAVERVTARLGLDTYRQDTSETGHPFSAPPIGIYIFHEDNGPNLIHSTLVLLALVASIIGWRRLSTVRMLYWLAWLTGIVAFAAIIRWNPYQVRYHLPAFAPVAPIVAASWPERWSFSKKTAALLLTLALTTIPVLLFNQSRELVPLVRNRPLPLQRDRPSYLTQSPLERLFVNQAVLLAPYEEAVDAIVGSNASQIGLLLGGDSWEYPVWRMLRDRAPDRLFRIEHVGLAEEERWPRGPFEPDALFWNNGEAPASIEINGREFARVGTSKNVAAYLPRETR